MILLRNSLLFPLLFFVNFLVFTFKATAAPQTCVLIKKIELEDENLLSLKRKNSFFKPYIGKCLNGKDISTLTHELTNKYTALGYITTTVNIPEQNIKSGILKLVVQQGQVESIEYEDNSNRLYDTVFGNTKGKIVNLRDIEQAYEHLNNLKSNDAKIELKPGTLPGHSIISVKNLPNKRWLVSLGIDNSGDKSKSKHLANTALGVDNLLGLNDTLFITEKRSLASEAKHRSNNYALLLSIPYNYYKFTLNYDYSYHKDPFEVAGQKITYTGHSNKGGLNINRVLLRNNTSKIDSSLGLRKSNYQEKLNDLNLEYQSHKLTVIETGLNYTKKLFGGFSSFSFNLEKGIMANATKYDNNDPYSPVSDFNKALYEISWMKNLGKFIETDLYFLSSLKGQYSPDILYYSEKFDLAGAAGVRGYSETSLKSENGLFSRNELMVSIPPHPSSYFSKLFSNRQIFVGIDLGKIKRNDEQKIKKGSAAGWTLGIRCSEGYVTLNSYIAKPLNWGSIPSSTTKHNIFFSISLNI